MKTNKKCVRPMTFCTGPMLPINIARSLHVHVFVMAFKRQNDVSPSGAITDITFGHFSVTNDVKAARAFRVVTVVS